MARRLKFSYNFSCVLTKLIASDVQRHQYRAHPTVVSGRTVRFSDIAN